jgi:hypothetical protein
MNIRNEDFSDAVFDKVDKMKSQLVFVDEAVGI